MVSFKLFCKNLFSFCICRKIKEETKESQSEVNNQDSRKSVQIYNNTELFEESKNKGKKNISTGGFSSEQVSNLNENKNLKSSKNKREKKNRLDKNIEQLEQIENIGEVGQSESFEEFEQNEDIKSIEINQSNLTIIDQQEIVVKFSDDEEDEKNDSDSYSESSERKISYDKRNYSSKTNKMPSKCDEMSDVDEDSTNFKSFTSEQDKSRYQNSKKSNKLLRIILNEKYSEKLSKEQQISEKRKIYKEELDKLLNTNDDLKKKFKKTKVKDSIEIIRKLDEKLKLTEEKFIEKVCETDEDSEIKFIHMFSSYSKKILRDNQYLTQKLVQLNLL